MTNTQYPSYTSEMEATYTNMESLILTKSPTPSPSGIIAITATAIKNHIPGNSFIDSKCGITFEYPLKWIIERVEPDPWRSNLFKCYYGLKPENYNLIVSKSYYCMSDYAIYIGVMELGLEDAARQNGFVYEDGSWYTRGYQGGRQSAEMISTRGLNILKGKFWVGKMDKTCISKAGIDELDSAVINAGKNKSIAIIDDITTFQLHFEYILQTVAFIN
jgi:hypothetical protein